MDSPERMSFGMEGGKQRTVVSKASSDETMESFIDMRRQKGASKMKIQGMLGNQGKEMSVDDVSQDTQLDDGGDDGYDGMEVNIKKGKMSSRPGTRKVVVKEEDVLVKTENVAAHPGPSNDDIDIDKKRAKKKIVFDTELNEHAAPYTLGVLEKRASKRILESFDIPPSTPQRYSISQRSRNRKETHDLITEINDLVKAKPKVEKRVEQPLKSFIYEPQLLSDFANLKVDPKTPANSGSFGQVVKVYDVKTTQTLVKKKVTGKVDHNEVEIPLQFPEAPNLARVVGLGWNGVETLIVQEDAGISLRQLICDKDLLYNLEKPCKLEEIMLDIFSAVRVLARHDIVHCDIKPENVCMNRDTWTCKLVDFGSSKTSQDRMTYAGLTPEYLPPSVNTFMYQVQKTKKVPSVLPRLGEKDDVWATGMVGLFLLKQAHPMIQYFTGNIDYPKGPPAKMQNERFEVMRKIGELKDPLPAPYFLQAGGRVISELLKNVLMVDEEKRWTAQQAVKFLEEKLHFAPARKMQKLEVVEEPKLHISQVEDTIVNIKKSKAIGRVMEPEEGSATRNDKAFGMEQSPVYGVAWKAPGLAMQQQQSGILYHSKMNKVVAPMPQMVVKREPARLQWANPFALTAAAAAVESSAWGQQPDMEDYDLLVDSFSTASVTTSRPSQPTRQKVPSLTQQPMYAKPPQYQPQQVQHHNIVVRQKLFDTAPFESAQRTSGLVCTPSPDCNFSVHGFTGTVFKFSGGAGKDDARHKVLPPCNPTAPLQGGGNVPDMEALMSAGIGSFNDPEIRPTLKARRKSRCSKD